MPRRLALILLLLPMAACSTPQSMQEYYNTYPKGAIAEGGLFRDESDKPYYADYWKRTLNARPHPAFATELADAYFDSLPYLERPPHRDKIRHEFIRGFFHGYTNPGGSIQGGEKDARWHGFAAGQLERASRPQNRTRTMTDFGYTLVTVDGTWTTHFEHSGFVPSAKPDQPAWWLESDRDSLVNLPAADSWPASGLPVRIVGYKSPAGNYGHLGSYPHEIFTTELRHIPETHRATGVSASPPKPGDTLPLQTESQ